MGALKVILGVFCIVASLPAGLLAILSFSNLGTADPVGSFFGSCLIALCATGIGCAGWFLISRQNAAVSKKALAMVFPAILAGIFPTAWVLSHPVESRNRGAEASGQLRQLELAIRQYKEEYDRFPIPTNITNLDSNDFTFGTWNTSVAALGITNATGRQANNSEIITILLSWTNCPDFIKAIKSRVKIEFPCIDANGVFLDPWGHPYIITLDLNGDNRCRDAFYRLASVSEIDSSHSQGLNELTRLTPPPYRTPEERNSFEAPNMVMVWSLGPNGKADRSQKANVGVNKYHILFGH